MGNRNFNYQEDGENFKKIKRKRKNTDFVKSSKKRRKHRQGKQKITFTE